MKKGLLQCKTALWILLCLFFFPIETFAFGEKRATISLEDANGRNFPDNKIALGENVYVTIETVNCDGDIDLSSLPKGLKYVYHTPSSSYVMRSVNGVSREEKKRTIVITMKAQTLGSYSFGPFRIDGIESNSVKYSIVEPSEKPVPQVPQTPDPLDLGSPYDEIYTTAPVLINRGNEEIFLKAQVNKTSVYEQEAVEYTVKLYTTFEYINFLGAAAAPQFDGFLMEDANVQNVQWVAEEINGKYYKTAVVARYIIFPQKAGKLQVKGNTYTVSADSQSSYMLPGYYYDPIATLRKPVQKEIKPNDVEIDVKPLPTPVPDNFIGGVGSFRVSASLPADRLHTGTGTSMLFTFEGSGNIKYLNMPDIASAFPPSFEIGTPSVTVDAAIQGATVAGKSTYDYLLVPSKEGDFTIPPISLSYFDPSSGSYRTLETSEFKVTVEAGEVVEKSGKGLKFDRDLMEVTDLSLTPDAPYVYSWLYWLWFVVPVAVFAIVLSLYRGYVRKHEDIVGLRSKQANRMALKRLSAAYKCLKANQEERFYDEMLNALWGYIGDKLKMPASELNRGNVSQEFKSHGVKEDTFMPIINLIDECEYAKYTPVARQANMRQLYADAIKSLAEVESEYTDRLKATGESDSGAETGNDDSRYINTVSLDQTSSSKPEKDESNEAQ